MKKISRRFYRNIARKKTDKKTDNSLVILQHVLYSVFAVSQLKHGPRNETPALG